MKNGAAEYTIHRLAIAQALVFLAYTGLRVGELASVKHNGEWFETVTEKERKGLTAKTRRIPISPNLKRLLPYIDVEAIKKLNKNTIKNHHSHDLRHTLVTYPLF